MSTTINSSIGTKKKRYKRIETPISLRNNGFNQVNFLLLCQKLVKNKSEACSVLFSRKVNPEIDTLYEGTLGTVSSGIFVFSGDNKINPP